MNDDPSSRRTPRPPNPDELRQIREDRDAVEPLGALIPPVQPEEGDPAEGQGDKPTSPAGS